VMDSETSELLEATINVYRSDNGALITTTTSDAVTGEFTTAALTYFTYIIQVRAYHHVPVNISVEIADPVVVKNFALDPTNGDILLIDDHAAAKAVADKFDDKGNLIALGYWTGGAKAVDLLVSDLEYLGYSAIVETMATTDPATWWSYDMLLVTSGDNTSSLADAAFRNSLVSFVEAGGHVLLEGGEVGYDHYGDTSFATTVMHTTDWNHDSSGDLDIADPTHYVASVPNVIGNGNGVTYNGYGDQDAMVPLADAVMVGTWSSYPTDASIICYDPNPAPEGGQIVFFTFNYGALAGTCSQHLLQNAVVWLLTPESGTSGVSGTVTLQGQSDHSGVLVEAIPGGGTTVTGIDGSYGFSGLFAGEYTIRVSKTLWSTDATTLTLLDGVVTPGVDFTLTPVSEVTECSAPALAIPDNNPTGVSDAITMALGGGETVSSVEVFVDITHTWRGDLIVTLTSPTGTTVTLHNRTGSLDDDIYGWYPTELTPEGDLGAFAGEDLDGDWTLLVSDNAGADTGTLNEWCLHFIYGGGSTAVGDDAPATFRLGANYPNPFNPSTTIKFAVPRAGHVSLDVYDLAGRHVRTLVDGELAATEHTVIWDGRNGSGSQMASGSYYYRLTADGFSQTEKMMLIK